MVTLADVIAQDDLALEVAHLAREHDDVRWVATSELVDPSPFLEGGEILLTTGLETAGWQREWDAYVARLARVGVVAIGLGVGLTHEELPERLVRACRRHGVTLFVVPRATTFVMVSRTVAQLLDAAEQKVAREALDLQRRLTQAALREDDQRALLVEAADALGGAAATATADGQWAAGPFGARPDLLELDAVTAEIARMRPRGLRAAAGVGTPGGTVLVHPLGLRGRPSTYLAVVVPGRVSEAQRGLVATTVALLSLASERTRDRRETDRRLRARAVELLVRGDGRTAEVVLGARAGADPAPVPRRLSVLRATGSSDALDDALGALEQEQDLVGLLDEELVAVLPAEVAASVAALAATYDLRVGVGAAVPRREVVQSHATAGHALAGTTAGAPVAIWDTNVGSGALSLMDAERASAFAGSFLGPLRGEQEGALRETLRSFLRHHGSHVAVAADLAIHRNTVLKRVRQIEQALGRSLDDPQVRVDAWIALQVDGLPRGQ